MSDWIDEMVFHNIEVGTVTETLQKGTSQTVFKSTTVSEELEIELLRDFAKSGPLTLVLRRPAKQIKLGFEDDTADFKNVERILEKGRAEQAAESEGIDLGSIITCNRLAKAHHAEVVCLTDGAVLLVNANDASFAALDGSMTIADAGLVTCGQMDEPHIPNDCFFLLEKLQCEGSRSCVGPAPWTEVELDQADKEHGWDVAHFGDAPVDPGTVKVNGEDYIEIAYCSKCQATATGGLEGHVCKPAEPEKAPTKKQRQKTAAKMAEAALEAEQAVELASNGKGSPECELCRHTKSQHRQDRGCLPTCDCQEFRKEPIESRELVHA